MQYIIDSPKTYHNIETLRDDLAKQDVSETSIFSLEQMELSTEGILKISGIGEFSITDIALRDALRRGGLHIVSCDNYFSQENPELDQAIVNAANKFYKLSKFSKQEIKLITRDEKDRRVALGIPSARYTLFSHEEAIGKLLPQLPSSYRMARCRLFPEFLEINFTDPVNIVKDTIGETVELGCSIINSQGTRTRSLMVSAFSLRLICLNGATAKDLHYAVRYPHKGNINGDFQEKISTITQNLSILMNDLPKLGSIPITDRFISNMRTDLYDAIGAKEGKKFIETIEPNKNMSDLWNLVTNLPHRIKNPTSKLKLENLGFKILTMNLHNYT